METIYINTIKVSGTHYTHSRRTSDGYEYDTVDYVKCDVWTSKPFLLYGCDTKISKYIHHLPYLNWPKEVIPKIHYREQIWPFVLCDILNFALNEYGYTFEPCPSDMVKKCIYHMVSHVTDEIFEDKYVFEVDRYYSGTLEELKQSIVELARTQNPIPNAWLNRLIEKYELSLEPFFRKERLCLDGRHLIYCNDEGELYKSIKDINNPEISRFLSQKPSITYLEACKQKDILSISWYVGAGAKRSYKLSPKLLEDKLNKISPIVKQTELDQELITNFNDEVDAWEEGWEWNID
jgi:hypothetical protein